MTALKKVKFIFFSPACFRFIFLCLFPFLSYPKGVVIFSDSSAVTSVNEQGLEVLRDEQHLSFQEIKESGNFTPYGSLMPTLPVGNYWIRFSIKNITAAEDLLLMLGHPRFHEVDLYVVRSDGSFTSESTGNDIPLSERKYKHQKYLFDLKIARNETVVCYMRVISTEFIVLPLHVGQWYSISDKLNQEDTLFGIYFGVFLSMIAYNLFIYLAVRDKVYLLYVVYAFFISLSQLSLFGYLNRFVFFNYPEIDHWVFILSSSLVGTSAAVFIRAFLSIDKYSPRLNIAIIAIALLFLSFAILDLLHLYQLKETFYDVLGLTGCILFYISVFTAIRRGDRPAKFLLAGWSVFFAGYILFILKNEGVLSYNWITNYGLTAGTVLETLLLSFALADRINTLRRDNDKKQKEIINYLESNEKYLRISKQLAIDAERLKKEILISEFESLKNQVNPHFLFNSLNVLADLVYEEQDEAVRFVGELAHVYRYVLDCKQKEIIELDAELKFINSYIFLLKIRFEENICANVCIPSTSRIFIAPVTLQLLLENAIKHNIISIEKPLMIEVGIDGDYIFVRNNIQLRRGHEKSTGVGLKNIISRYQFLSDKEVLIINDGTEFVVKIPVLFQDMKLSEKPEPV